MHKVTTKTPKEYMVWLSSSPNSLIVPSLLKRKDGRVVPMRSMDNTKNAELMKILLFGTKNIITVYYIN